MGAANVAIIAFGDLLLTLTSAYVLRYSDKGSGADMNGSYWCPVSQARGMRVQVPG